jgi:hypothetical protein
MPAAPKSPKPALSNSENTLPVHLIFTKEINRKKDAMSPKKTVKGNVILFVSERTIDKFNIPIYTGDIPMHRNIPDCTRTLQDGGVVNISGYQAKKRNQEQSARKIKILYGHSFKTYDGSIDHYLINFPWFFNLSMIRDSLFVMFKANAEGTRFMALPSRRKRDIYIGNKDGVSVALGSGKLIQGMNVSGTRYSPCTIIGKSTLRKPKKVKGQINFA